MMTGLGWLTAGLAGLMLLIAGGCVVRLATWRRRDRAAGPEADVLHALMGVAMAGMLEPRLSPVPDAVWRAVFGVAVTWFAWRAIRARISRRDAGRERATTAHHAMPHAVQCAAMLYMLVPARSAVDSAGMAMTGMSTSGFLANPAIALLLVAFMLVYVMWTADQFAGRSRARTSPVPAGQYPPGSTTADAVAADTVAAGTVAAGTVAAGTVAAHVPSLRFEAGCAIVMSIAMGYMLLPML
jgi:hypothetical protein